MGEEWLPEQLLNWIPQKEKESQNWKKKQTVLETGVDKDLIEKERELEEDLCGNRK